MYEYLSISPRPIVFYSQRAYFEMENEFRMLAKLIRLQCTLLSACVCAHQCMYVHAFVLIIRLHWPLRWHRSLWIINTEQIKILFKSLPRKLASREREAHALDHYRLLSPHHCFLFSPVSECFLHVYNSIPRLFVSAAMPFLHYGYYLTITKVYLTSTGDKYFWVWVKVPKLEAEELSIFSFLHEFLLDTN